MKKYDAQHTDTLDYNIQYNDTKHKNENLTIDLITLFAECWYAESHDFILLSMCRYTKCYIMFQWLVL